jgi:hypothetical protein
LLLLGTILIEGVNEELDVIHRVDVEALADAVDHNEELLLVRSSFTHLVCLVVDEVPSLLDQDVEDVLDAVEVLGEVGIFNVTGCCLRLVVMFVVTALKARF